MLNTSVIAHSKGLSIAFMLYFQPKLKKDFFKEIHCFFPQWSNLILKDAKFTATELRRAGRYSLDPRGSINSTLT